MRHMFGVKQIWDNLLVLYPDKKLLGSNRCCKNVYSEKEENPMFVKSFGQLSFTLMSFKKSNCIKCEHYVRIINDFNFNT